MHRIQLHYTLSRDAGDAQIRNPLPEMLEAVAQQGSISAAARTLGMSYRHVWGALKRWEEQLGGELIIWGKGQSAQLSEFGTKLLWAERHAQARMAEMHGLIEDLVAWYDDVKHLDSDRLAMLLSLGSKVTRLLDAKDRLVSFGRPRRGSDEP